MFIVLVLVLHCCDKIPEQNNLREARCILAHGFRVSFHHGREGMVGLLAHCGGQEAESENACSSGFSPSPFIPPGSQPMGWCCHIQDGSSPLVNPLWRALTDTPSGVLS
jgi:hypothetical protein